jgi:hypothetical protein
VRRVVVFGEEAGAVGGEYEEGVDLGRRSGAVSVSWDEAERARTEKRERLGDMVGDCGQCVGGPEVLLVSGSEVLLLARRALDSLYSRGKQSPTARDARVRCAAAPCPQA